MEGTERSRDQEVLLTTVSNDMEADMVQELLKGNGIPSLKKHRGHGEYMQIVMGITNLGIDIYVMSSQFEEAKALLAGRFNVNPGETEEVIEEIIVDEIETEDDIEAIDYEDKDDVAKDEKYFLNLRNQPFMIFFIYFVITYIIMLLLSSR